MAKGAKNHRRENIFSFLWGIVKGISLEKIVFEFVLET